MYKLIVLAVVVAVANAGAVNYVYTAPVVQSAVVGYTAGVKTTALDAKVPASTTLVKHENVVSPVVSNVVSPVVYSAGVHGVPAVYSAAGVPAVYSAAGVPTVYNAGVPTVYNAGVPAVYNAAGVPTVYSAGVPSVYSAGYPTVYSGVYGANVVTQVKPVEQHGYKVVY